jgi:hypothetical protein
MDISDINGDMLAINTGLSMSRWNFSDEDSSPEPINIPSQFIISANSTSSPAILPDSILAGDSDADEESTDVECTGIPDEISFYKLIVKISFYNILNGQIHIRYNKDFIFIYVLLLIIRIYFLNHIKCYI